MKTQELQQALKQLYSIVPKRTVMPILETFAIQHENGRIAITANNLKTAMTLYVPSQDNINCCVPAKQFNEIANLLRSTEIEIQQHEDKIVIKKNPGRATIKTLPYDDFPTITIPDSKNAIEFDAITIATALQRASISVSDNESHPVLNGALIKSSENVLKIASADGFRMTYIELLFGLDDFEIIIPQSSIAPLVSILKQNNKANLSVNENQLVIWNDNFIFTTQLVAGKFPDVNKLLVNQYSTKIRLSKSDLLNAIRQALVYASDQNNVVRLKIEQNQIIVHGESFETGENKTPIKCEMEGKPLELAVNGNYIEDALKLVTDGVIIKFNEPTSPLGFFIPGNDLVHHIIMPMHL